MKTTGNRQITDIMTERQSRQNHTVYFLRINAYSIQVEQLLRQVIERARKMGVLIDGKLASPDVHQITYYQEMIGDGFDLELSFIESALSKWLPRLDKRTLQILSNAIYGMLTELKQLGKNVNIIKNAFVKYMCWLFYKFSQIATHLTDNLPPIILYVGDISIYELQMLTIMHTAGCDVLLLQTHGDQSYLQLDPKQTFSQELFVPGGTAFPENYCLKTIMDAMAAVKQNAAVAASSRSNVSSQRVAPSHSTQPLPPSASSASVSAPRNLVPPQTPSSVSQRVSQHEKNDAPLNRPSCVPPPVPSTPSSSVLTGPKPVVFGPEPQLKLQTNQWFVTGSFLNSILTPCAMRNADSSCICNAFCRICGVSNVSTYENDLYQFYQKMNASGRRMVIVENGLPTPSTDEINKIRRGNYRFAEDMIRDLMVNFSLGISQEIAKYAVRGFGSVMLEESKKQNMTLGKLTATAVYLICWFRKWQSELFNGWKAPTVSCFIYFGQCNKDKDILFLRMLAYMPVDVVLIQPNLNEMGMIEDERLKTEMSLESLNLSEFPKTSRIIHATTEGYQAECDLDSIDVGVYRNRQFTKAKVVPIHSSEYEIEDIWHQDILDRPNAEIVQGVVNFPVLFSKLSGVSQDKEEEYWLHVKQFITPETILISKLPFAGLSEVSQAVSSFYKNGKLLKDRIKMSRFYKYNLLRNDMQEHILNCLQSMLDTKLIRSSENTEQIVIAAAMSLNMDICRLIQQFDFVRKTPKLIILHTNETLGNIQDAIQLAFLSMIGFDILIFSPTGYQCVEQWYNYPIVDEHQVGEYHYNYHVPNFNTLGEKQSWFSRFKRN